MLTSRSAALAAARVLVPLGCALAAGALVAAVVPPHWNAPGLPFFAGHPKNVESAAVAAGYAAAVAATLLGVRRAACLVAAAGGFAALLAYGHLRVLAAAWLPLSVALLAPFLLGATRRRAGFRSASGGNATTDIVPRARVAAATGALALVAFVLGTEPLGIDVFHHGEVLASALDLLHGGVPFKSYIWPHGVHDTGLAALWIAASGKVGTSAIALARATCRALGVLAGYALARRLLDDRRAALGVATVLALLPLHGTLPKPAECPDALYQLGILAFVIGAFVALTAQTRGASVLAGVFLACGYLFRIETALYGAVASVALLATRLLGEPRAPIRTPVVGDPHVTAAARLPGSEGDGTADGDRAGAVPPFVARLRACAGAGTALALGVVLTLVVSRVVLGWPGAAWLDYTLRELPRHHRDAVGVPFPWPLRGEATPALLPHRGTALAWLCFVLALAVAATRAVAARGARREVLVFVATFAFLATRSSLDRSDDGHFLQWAALPLVAVALLLLARARDAGWSPAARALFLVTALLWIDGPIVRAAPLLVSPAALAATAAERWRATVEHLAPNPPVGACADATMTPIEAERPRNARFLAAVCDLETLLRRHGTTGLVVAHSAPWYHVRLGFPSPSRYFAFARAYTPEAQLALVDDLRAARPNALFRARGFEALEIFDLPDAVRVPIVDAYLRARTGGVRRHPTPLGDVYFWNEPESDDAPILRAPSEETVAYPDAGCRLVFGWTTDAADGAPLLGITAGDNAGRYLAIDGRVITPAPSARVRTLARLDGDEWRELATAIEHAAALGRADRDAASELSRSEAQSEAPPVRDAR